VIFKLGGAGLLASDFATICTMRINRMDVNDEVATLQLESMGSILNRSIPTKTWGDGSFTGQVAEPGALSLVQPWLIGEVSSCKLTLGNRDILNGKYYTVDPSVIPAGVNITAMTAVDRATNVQTALNLISDVSLGVAGFTPIVNGAFSPDTYDMYAAMSEVLAPVRACGSFAMRLLFLCGEDAANIDTAAFTAADAANPASVGVYLDTPQLAADVMRKLEQSCLGQVYVGADGRWTMRLFDPSLPANGSLSDSDFVTWNPTQDLAAVLNEVRVQYREDAFIGALETGSSDDAILYGSETSDSHRVSAYLRTEDPAVWLAGHLRFLSGVPASYIQFEERGLTLMAASVGDLIGLTRARAPIARTGTAEGQLFEIVRLEKSLDGPRVTGVLNDLNGQADHIARCLDTGVDLDWSAATAAQKALYGFCGDANRYIDPADAQTKDLKVVW